MYWRNRQENQKLFREAARQGVFIIKVVTAVISTVSDVLELTALHCVYHNQRFFADRHYHSYVRPDRKISDKTLERHGLTMADLEAGLPVKEAFQSFRNFLGPTPYLISYGSFDIDRLQALYEEQGETLALSGRILMKDVCNDVLCEADTPDMKFATVAEIFQVPEHKNLGGLSYAIRMKTLLNGVMRKLWEPRDPNLIKARVYGITYYPGFRGITRLYVNTSEGTIYYDMTYDKWAAKEKESRLTRRLDMQDIENQVFALAKCSSYAELKRFKGEAGYGRY